MATNFFTLSNTNLSGASPHLSPASKGRSRSFPRLPSLETGICFRLESRFAGWRRGVWSGFEPAAESPAQSSADGLDGAMAGTTDYGLGELTFSCGWFQIGSSAELEQGWPQLIGDFDSILFINNTPVDAPPLRLYQQA
jgi:hypothetical protein